MPAATSTPLVSTDWLAAHLDDPAIRLIESDADGEYAAGHLPGAIAWDWRAEILGGFRLQPIAAPTMERLLRRSGITPETTIVLYGTWPTLTCWLLGLFGHERVSLLDGGRARWLAEGRPLITEVPTPAPATYRVGSPDLATRATHDEILAALGSGDHVLLDVRTAAEYRGEHMWPGEAPGYCQRAGHIPGAHHLAWNTTTHEDGSFRPLAELRQIAAAHGLAPADEVIPYCTIGGRSSHVWFVLSRLLGYPRVRLYDGSWLEWAHLVDAPVEC